MTILFLGPQDDLIGVAKVFPTMEACKAEAQLAQAKLLKDHIVFASLTCDEHKIGRLS